MTGPEQTFTPRVVGVDHGEAVFAVDYRQSFFRRNLRRPLLTTASTVIARRDVFKVLSSFDLGLSAVTESVNRLLEHGADPIFTALTFWGLEKRAASDLVKGGIEGCREAGCAMAPPLGVRHGVSSAGASVTAVGVVDQKRIVDSRRVLEGDLVLGVEAEGFLPVDFGERETPLEGFRSRRPARPLARQTLQILTRYRRKKPVHAVAAPGLDGDEETEGARRFNVYEAIEAKLPPGLRFRPAESVEGSEDRELPLSGAGPSEALRRGRCGLGLVLVTAPHFAHSIKKQFARRGITAFLIGSVEREEIGPRESRP